ncbi:hypothetical protein Hdeb2414_s0023g00622931 [Helianthus debilis subsp. tardiflorus]
MVNLLPKLLLDLPFQISRQPVWIEQYICSLEGSLKEEMARHMALYGAGLEALSITELETIAHIHEEGLIQVRCLSQCKGSCPSGRPHGHNLYVGAPTPKLVGHPMGVHGNGNANGTTGPWFNHS